MLGIWLTGRRNNFLGETGRMGRMGYLSSMGRIGDLSEKMF